MTEPRQSNGVHRELERRAAELRARFRPGEDASRREEPPIAEIDERAEHSGAVVRALTPPPKSLIIATAAVFAAAAFFALRSRNRRRPAIFGRLMPPSPVEKSLLVRGLEKGGLSLIALAVQRLGTRGLDRWLGAEALPEPAALERETHAVAQAD